MHVSTALDTIKKQGTFKAYKEAQEAYVEQYKVAKQAKATLAQESFQEGIREEPL